MIRTIASLSLGVCLLAGCGTTDSSLQEQGRSQAFITGFHDGRHSGLREAGNRYEHYVKDVERFESDADYKAGWLAGEAEGKKIQAQAVTVGNAAAGAYSAHQVGEEINKNDPEKVAKDALKGVDTGTLKSLED